jgi:hypothetical protein
MISDLVTYAALFAWFVVNTSLFFYRFFHYDQDESHLYLRVVLSHGLGLARASAFCLNFNCALVFLAVCRNVLSWMRYFFPRCLMRTRFRRWWMRLSDQHLTFHRCIAYAICFWSVIHVAAHVSNYERLFELAQQQQDNRTMIVALNPFREKRFGVLALFRTTAGVTGVILSVILLLMLSSSTMLMRRSFYNIFWLVHHLFVVFVICLLIHGSQRLIRYQINVDEHDPEYCVDRGRWNSTDDRCRVWPRFVSHAWRSWMWVCAPVGIYALERLLRLIRSLQAVKIVGVIRHPSDVIEIHFDKKTMRRPHAGQYLYLKFYSMSTFQWHPFTVTSSGGDAYVSVHIRMVGDWTRELGRRLARFPCDVPMMSVDGPYGSPADDVFDYDHVLLIGAGIGGE